MKKFLLLFALSSIIYVSCDSDDDDDDTYTVTSEYVLNVTPTTVTIGDDLTLSVSGSDADDMLWVTYCESVDMGSYTKVIPYIVDGESVTLSTSDMAAGEYIFYSQAAKIYVQTEDVYVTVVE